MKIAIISDIHDNIINLEKCLNWCKTKKIDEIICCGDVTNIDTLDFLTKNFNSTIHLVRGNMEIFDDLAVDRYENIRYYGRIGRFLLAGFRIGLCHELFLVEEVLKKGECDRIFYGHTHKPWQSRKHGAKLINPGTLGGVFSKASFAYWETENDDPELIIMEKI